MNSNLQLIQFFIVYDDQELVLNTYRGEYRNLMVLIYDRLFPDDFGDCGGLGRCGTCMIEVLHADKVLPESGRNEESTLQRYGKEGTSVRLACQMPVDEALNGLKIRILVSKEH